MRAHQPPHQQGHRASRGRDHRGSAADDGDGHGDDERGVERHRRIDPGDEGEGQGFGDQGQGDDRAGQQVTARIGKPLLAR